MARKLQRIVLESVLAGVKTAVASDTTDATRKDTMEITNAVVDEIGPVVAHVTNTEPWYQSRVTLGAILTAVAGVVGIFGYAFPAEVQGKVIEATIALAPLVGAAITLYGRWVAKKPLGS